MAPQLLLVCCDDSTNLQPSKISVLATADDNGTSFCPFEENRPLAAIVALLTLDCGTLFAGSMVAVTGLGLVGVERWLRFCVFIAD